MKIEILKKFAHFIMKIGSTFDGSVFRHPVSTHLTECVHTRQKLGEMAKSPIFIKLG